MQEKLFDIAIATIFAREVLEGAIVIGQYRTVLLRSPEWQEEERLQAGLRAITMAAIYSSLVALLVIVAIALPIALVSDQISDKVIQIIEGVSKVVAAICVMELSIKIPKWLGIYKSKKSKEELEVGLTLKSIRFNVAWNIWREVAETGVFLLPFFFDSALAIPLSAVCGTVLSLILGMGIYYGNKKQKNMKWLAVTCAAVTGQLSVGLFSGGCHLLEKASGRPTKTVWTLEGKFWSTDRLPMTIIKPFGYSSSRTILQIVTFWSFLTLLLVLHYLKWRASKQLEDSSSVTPPDVLGLTGELDVEANGVHAENESLKNKGGGVYKSSGDESDAFAQN